MTYDSMPWCGRNDELRRKEAEAAAERAALEQLEKQIKDAKGAKYTIDDKGRFILIKEVRATQRRDGWGQRVVDQSLKARKDACSPLHAAVPCHPPLASIHLLRSIHPLSDPLCPLWILCRGPLAVGQV
jgi:hypothetical protein